MDELKTKFLGPRAIAVDGGRNIYVGYSGRIGGLQKFLRDGTPAWAVEKLKVRGLALQASGAVCLTNVEGEQGVKMFTADGICRQTCDGEFRGPTGIAANRQGELYVVESSWWPGLGGHRVQKFDPTGQLLLQWGGEGSAPGQFNLPTGIALDAEENVFVADSYNSRIQKFAPDGTFLAAWGAHGTEPGQLNCPQGLAVDGAGDLWVADTYNNRIQQFTAAGKFLTARGRQGTGAGEFWLPCGIAVDQAGTVYVADTMNNRVQVRR